MNEDFNEEDYDDFLEPNDDCYPDSISYSEEEEDLLYEEED